MNAMADFFRKYDAVRVDGVPEPFQEAHVRAVWAQRDAERDARAFADDLLERRDLRLLLSQTVAPLTPEQRATLETKLAACQRRIEAFVRSGGRTAGEE